MNEAEHPIILVFYVRFLLAGSNHYGIAGWYALRASDQGLLVSD